LFFSCFLQFLEFYFVCPELETKFFIFKEEPPKEEDQKKEEKTTKATTLNGTDAENSKNETKPQPKQIISRETFKFSTVSMDIMEVDDKYVEEKRKKLEAIREREKDKRKRASAINSLESFIYDTKYKLEEKDFELCTTKEEREETLAKLNEYNEWLFDADDTVETKVNYF
jgi:hypothetical protein